MHNYWYFVCRISAICGDYYIGGRRFESLALLVGYYTSCSYLLKGEQLKYPVSPPEVKSWLKFIYWKNRLQFLIFQIMFCALCYDILSLGEDLDNFCLDLFSLLMIGEKWWLFCPSPKCQKLMSWVLRKEMCSLCWMRWVMAGFGSSHWEPMKMVRYTRLLWMCWYVTESLLFLMFSDNLYDRRCVNEK